jgi:hypothetical protein
MRAMTTSIGTVGAYGNWSTSAASPWRLRSCMRAVVPVPLLYILLYGLDV